MKTMTRALRLTTATAAALVLMTAAAQARPIGINPGQTAATNTVTLAPDRVDRIGEAPRFAPSQNVPDRVDKLGTADQHRVLAPLGAGTVVVHSTSTNGGFDWTAAAIGAGTALLIVLIVGGGGITMRGRRGVALSS